MSATSAQGDHLDTLSGQLVRWEHLFPYRGGQVLVARLNGGWRLKLSGREASSRSLVTAFEHARGRPCADPEIKVVLTALAYNEHQHGPAAHEGAPHCTGTRS